MPEGDTIYQCATRLRPVLEGQTVTVTATTINVEQVTGQQVEAIETQGKHLLIRFESGIAVHTHLGMQGSWHVYAADEPWRKPASRAAISLQTPKGMTAVCFTPKTLELLSRDKLRRHRWLTRLGPDMLDPNINFQRVIANLRRHGTLPIGEALLNQTSVTGIGNVYKSELIFLQQVDPFRAVVDFTDQQLLQLLRAGQRLMRMNLSGGPRRTRVGRDGNRAWVYRRSGQPCFKCGTTIRMKRQGDLGRSTYWCPDCQASK